MAGTVVERIDEIGQARADAASHVMRAVAGAFETFSIYIGDQLGFYEVLASDGPLTAPQLAARTGTDTRYVREWLEQQAVAGLLVVEDAGSTAHKRRVGHADGFDEVLADRESLDYLAPLAQLVAGAASPVEDVVRAFRTGAGVPYERYGRDLREGQARMNRVAFLRQLGEEWLPAVPGLAERLSIRGARVADLGCGAGWSSLGIARSFPNVRVDGFDLDEASIALAEAHAVTSGLADRVRFAVRDAGDPALFDQYDLVVALECVHDMGDPVAALRTMRRLAKTDGTVLVVDERVADHFDPRAGGFEWLMYGFSVLHCLPSGRATPGSRATGTVMRTSTLTAYASEAGFSTTEVLPIEHPLFRFYRLHR